MIASIFFESFDLKLFTIDLVSRFFLNSLSVIVLIKLMVEYCQFSLDIPNLTFDVMTRIVEIFKVAFLNLNLNY